MRDRVGTLLLRLTLKELYEWRFMQTDPNWGNFLYDADSGRLHLIDFGAAKEYPSRWATQGEGARHTHGTGHASDCCGGHGTHAGLTGNHPLLLLPLWWVQLC